MIFLVNQLFSYAIKIASNRYRWQSESRTTYKKGAEKIHTLSKFHKLLCQPEVLAATTVPISLLPNIMAIIITAPNAATAQAVILQQDLFA